MTAGQSLRLTERRRFRRFVAISAGWHVLAAAMLGFAPSRPAPFNPPIISVDLLASLPGEASRQEPAASAPPSKPYGHDIGNALGMLRLRGRRH